MAAAKRTAFYSYCYHTNNMIGAIDVQVNPLPLILTLPTQARPARTTTLTIRLGGGGGLHQAREGKQHVHEGNGFRGLKKGEGGYMSNK